MDESLSHPSATRFPGPPPRPADNPFSVQRIEHVLGFRPEWVGLAMDSLLDRVLADRGPLAIIGRHGAGKTTLLDSILRELEARGHPVARMFFNADDQDLAGQINRVEAITRHHVVGIDGDEHLGWLKTRSLWTHLRGARQVLLARHQAGRFPVLARLAPDTTVLHQCVRALSPDWYPVLAPELDAMFQRERGNIRQCLWSCYDRVGCG